VATTTSNFNRTLHGGGQDIVTVEIDGLERLLKEPVMSEPARRSFVDRGMKILAKNVAAAAPGGPDGSLGRSIYGYALSADRGIVGSTHPGAKALDRGAFITPRSGKAIRFEIDGQPVFARYVRLKARRYFRKGLENAGQVLQQEFNRMFGER
jgi:hypothetical protein